LTGKSDVLRLSSRLAQDKQQMVTAINRLEQALIQLNQFVNNPLSRKIDIEDLGAARGFFHELGYDHFNHLLDNDDSRERFIQFLVEVAKENSPELKSLAFADKVIDSQMELFGVKRMLPTIGLNANYIKFLERSGVGSEIEGLNIPNEYYTVGLGISLPIFSGNRNNISYQKARIQKDQVSLNLSDANLALETRIRSTVYDVINQMATIKLTRETEENAKEALELIQAAYNSGAVNVVQLFDVQNTYLQAQIGRIQADYGYLMSLISLERMISHYSILNSKEENEQLRNRFLTFTR
ncbi:MAG: TolC family protein, partial [Bacteroidota bacterium]